MGIGRPGRFKRRKRFRLGFGLAPTNALGLVGLAQPGKAVMDRIKQMAVFVTVAGVGFSLGNWYAISIFTSPKNIAGVDVRLSAVEPIEALAYGVLLSAVIVGGVWLGYVIEDSLKKRKALKATA
jgi:hypothetical protein